MRTRRRARVVLDPFTARSVLAELSAARGGVLDRREVVRRGVPRWLLQAELRTRRWQRTGRQTVVTHNSALTPAQRRAVAVLEVGPRAALDGVTALERHGMRGVDGGPLHVIAPKGSTPRRAQGVRVHESRRFDEADVVLRDGVRVVRPAVAAVHAALWATSDRQARLFVILVVQQRLARPAQVEAAVQAVRRSRRKALLRGIAADVNVGVRAAGELDFSHALRRRGLPEPDRQQVRRRPSGTEYLDCRFDAFNLTVELDGKQHDEPEQRVEDLVRDLTLLAEGDAVVRIPMIALRLDEARVLAALEQVFRSRGWRRAA